MDLIVHILVPTFCMVLIKNKDMADIPFIHQTQIVFQLEQYISCKDKRL